MDDNLSLPSRDSEREEEVPPGVATYLVRLTPIDDAFTLEDVKAFLNNDQFTSSEHIGTYPYKWLCGVEHKPKLHYHVVIETLVENPKEIFRQQVYRWFPVRSRGFGSKHWNFQVSYNPEHGLIYAMKHGEYYFHGYDEQYLVELSKLSFTKDPKSFKSELDLLNKNFQEDPSLDIADYMNIYTSLKSKYQQQVNMQQAYQYALSALFRREPDQISGEVNNYLQRIS